MVNYENYSKEELINHIYELEKQLKSNKYGLYWDKHIEPEKVISKCKDEIPIFIREENLCITTDANADTHILIEGDNFHTLSTLNMMSCNEGFVDVIYIDPPYNRGKNDFRYNDKYVNKDDGYRHSKWISFMHDRLQLARKLLKDTGVIFISIDKNEFAQLKLLCDKIFGEKNHMGDIIRKTKTTNADKNTGFNCQHDYVYVYSKTSKSRLKGDMKEFKNYKNPDNDPNGKWCSGDPSAKSGGDSTYFPIENPYTHKIDYPPNGRYWAFSEETLQTYVEKGRIVFKKEHKKNQRGFIFKRYVNKDNLYNHVNSLFAAENEYMNKNGTEDLKKFFSNNDFEYPKPVHLIKKLIEYSTDKNSIILDFFAGSGTTAQAVLEMNKEDNGHRKIILCTNNEDNICKDITYPRIKTVITGHREDGLEYSEGNSVNLMYYRTGFITNSLDTDQAKYSLVEKVDELLCIKEETYVAKERTEHFSHHESFSGEKHTFIYSDYYNVESFSDFIKLIDSVNGEKIVYMFSTDNVIDEKLFENINNITIKPIPRKIYDIYKEIVEDIKRGEQ